MNLTVNTGITADLAAHPDHVKPGMLTYLEATVSFDADGQVVVTLESRSLQSAIAEALEG